MNGLLIDCFAGGGGASKGIDFVCDLHGLGPEETVFVMEDWEPTEHFLQCRREARHE